MKVPKIEEVLKNIEEKDKKGYYGVISTECISRPITEEEARKYGIKKVLEKSEKTKEKINKIKEGKNMSKENNLEKRISTLESFIQEVADTQNDNFKKVWDKFELVDKRWANICDSLDIMDKQIESTQSTKASKEEIQNGLERVTKSLMNTEKIWSRNMEEVGELREQVGDLLETPTLHLSKEHYQASNLKRKELFKTIIDLCME